MDGQTLIDADIHTKEQADRGVLKSTERLAKRDRQTVFISRCKGKTDGCYNRRTNRKTYVQGERMQSW